MDRGSNPPGRRKIVSLWLSFGAERVSVCVAPTALLSPSESNVAGLSVLMTLLKQIEVVSCAREPLSLVLTLGGSHDMKTRKESRAAKKSHIHALSPSRGGRLAGSAAGPGGRRSVSTRSLTFREQSPPARV
jgi:hypothetical protein